MFCEGKGDEEDEALIKKTSQSMKHGTQGYAYVLYYCKVIYIHLCSLSFLHKKSFGWCSSPEGGDYRLCAPPPPPTTNQKRKNKGGLGRLWYLQTKKVRVWYYPCNVPVIGQRGCGPRSKSSKRAFFTITRSSLVAGNIIQQRHPLCRGRKKKGERLSLWWVDFAEPL